MKKIILKHALKNAHEHNGKAAVKAVVNRVVGEKPALKKDMKKINKEVALVVRKVNRMSKKQQLTKLLEVWPTALERRDEERRKLPELKKAKKGKVVMRMAPNPDGALHIGNSRQMLLNWFYVKKYNGKYILRFDDTDPKIKKPIKQAYRWIIDDHKWLGIKIDQTLYASSRLDIYYKYAKKLLELGKAYVCTCKVDKFRELKKQGKACPCRNLSKKEQLERWERMHTTFREGEAVYRVKTDLKDPNPALRDWPGLRIVNKPDHPRIKGKKVWPLLNFNSAIDDHLTGITHIIRGRDLDFTELQQKYLYKHFKWKYPETIVTGKLHVEGVVMSKTAIRKGIIDQTFKGWEDSRLGTLKALKKRGITPQGIKQLIWDLGVKKNNVILTWSNIEAAQEKAMKAPTFKE